MRPGIERFGMRVPPRCSAVPLSVVVRRDDAADREALLSHADTALYRAKTDGRNTYRFFEAEMGEQVLDRRRIEQDLRFAIARRRGNCVDRSTRSEQLK